LPTNEPYCKSFFVGFLKYGISIIPILWGLIFSGMVEEKRVLLKLALQNLFLDSEKLLWEGRSQFDILVKKKGGGYKLASPRGFEPLLQE
jgi:hypothetical protein